jgi:proteasome accessory factor A
MGVRRVMGIETEYGVSNPADAAANPMLMSGQVVSAYAAPLGTRAGRARWDYEDENPLADARGWQVRRAGAHPSQLTDTPGGEFAEELDDPTMANVVLTNGARLYVDHAHPEYSSPEVTNPLDALRWDKAGERIMLAAVRRIAESPGLAPVNLYKNTTDTGPPRFLTSSRG